MLGPFMNAHTRLRADDQIIQIGYVKLEAVYYSNQCLELLKDKHVSMIISSDEPFEPSAAQASQPAQPGPGTASPTSPAAAASQQYAAAGTSRPGPGRRQGGGKAAYTRGADVDAENLRSQTSKLVSKKAVYEREVSFYHTSSGKWGVGNQTSHGNPPTLPLFYAPFCMVGWGTN